MALNRKGWPKAGKAWEARKRNGGWWEKPGQVGCVQVCLSEDADDGERIVDLDVSGTYALASHMAPAIRDIADFLAAEEIRK